MFIIYEKKKSQKFVNYKLVDKNNSFTWHCMTISQNDEKIQDEK